MKKVIFIFIVLIISSCIDSSDTPIIDKLNNIYQLDSIYSEYEVNGRQYTTKSYSILNSSSFTYYNIGTDTNENYGIFIPDSASTVEDITEDSIYKICINTPTITGANLLSCNDQTDSFSYSLINDSTIFITFDSSIEPSAYGKTQLEPEDSILNITGELTLYNSLK